MAAQVKVCGCRPYEGGAAHTGGAGVRKPPREETAGDVARWRVRRFLRHGPDGSLCTASVERYFHVIAPNGIVLALHINECISHRIGSGIRNSPRRRCRLATFAALPTLSVRDRAINVLNDHRFRGYASGPSSSGNTLPSSIHSHAARRSALPRERFSPLTPCGSGRLQARAP
jgi:hypothetical protein